MIMQGSDAIEQSPDCKTSALIKGGIHVNPELDRKR